MIYLNQAGTSWPKPPPVTEVISEICTLDPLEWSERFHSAHQSIAHYFHIGDRSRLLLTPSCTTALQIAVSDQGWQSGDRALASSMEHHALIRPLEQLRSHGVQVDYIPRSTTGPFCLDSLEDALQRQKAKLVAVSAASNVTGEFLPLAEIVALSRRYGARVLIDGAQVAGWWDLDVPALGSDLFTFAGHKGPQAPWGIGGLYVAPDCPMQCLAASCDVDAGQRHTGTTGGTMPGYCDAGSVNLLALCGMAAAIRWLSANERSSRLNDCRKLAMDFEEAVARLANVELLGTADVAHRMPTVAIKVPGQDSAEWARLFRERGVMVGSGFQCAPMAHQALGTEKQGALRFSFGPLNTAEQANRAAGHAQQLFS